MEKIGDKLTGAFDGGQGSSRRQAFKKLKKFYDKQNSVSSRFKSMIAFLERAAEEDLTKFFAESFMAAYEVFSAFFSTYENQCKSKARYDASCMKDILLVLKNIFQYLKDDYISKGWQSRSIGLWSFSFLFFTLVFCSLFFLFFRH